jgi:hypothetical protein
LRSVFVVLTAVAVLVAPLSSADARRRHRRPVSVGSQVVIEGATAAGNLNGRVLSEENRCLQDRIVRISRNNVAIGAASSDSSGRWFLNIGPSPAGSQIVARVDPAEKTTRRFRITCGAASDSITT